MVCEVNSALSQLRSEPDKASNHPKCREEYYQPCRSCWQKTSSLNFIWDTKFIRLKSKVISSKNLVGGTSVVTSKSPSTSSEVMFPRRSLNRSVDPENRVIKFHIRVMSSGRVTSLLKGREGPCDADNLTNALDGIKTCLISALRNPPITLADFSVLGMSATTQKPSTGNAQFMQLSMHGQAFTPN